LFFTCSSSMKDLYHVLEMHSFGCGIFVTVIVWMVQHHYLCWVLVAITGHNRSCCMGTPYCSPPEMDILACLGWPYVEELDKQ
jgi:hypothetical protein